MIKIIIVNGRPRAGKDTLIGFMQNHLREAGVPTMAFSSIDPVRDLLTGAGFDLSGKTEADRKLLAVVGAAVEEHSHWRTQACIDEIVSFDLNYGGGVVFLHIREPANIERIRQWVADVGLEMGFSMTTVLLRSNREELVNSNGADASVDDVDYDYRLENNGTPELLSWTAKMFLIEIGAI